MKTLKKMGLTLSLLSLILMSFAQTPQSFKYQVVVRDAGGDPVQNENVGFRFRIHDSNPSGSVVYSETHTVLTNAFGLAGLNIGAGIPVSGVFSAIDWGTNQKFLEVEIDLGSGYTSMGTSQLLSVPYALYSENTANVDDADADPENELQTISKVGNTVTLSDGGGAFTDETEDADADPENELQSLSITGNELSISDGNSVTLPGSGATNRISDSDGNTWIDAELNSNNDSIVLTTMGMNRMTIRPNGYVNVNGQMVATGFQGDGSGLTGVPGDNLGDHIASEELDMNNHRIVNIVSPMNANDAATKLYVDTHISLGGDNLGNHTATQNIELNGFRLSYDGDDEGVSVSVNGNVGINEINPQTRLHVNGSIRMVDGNQSEGRILVSDENGTAAWGDLPAPGDNDWVISGDNMYSEVSGNVGIGTPTPGAKLDVAGHIWQTGVGNSLFLGVGAGNHDDLSDNRNVFIGGEAGNLNTTGSQNTAIGYQSFMSNTTGDFNTATGYLSLASNTTANGNTAYGYASLNKNTTGHSNTANGVMALYNNTTGHSNTTLGTYSLYMNTTGVANTANGIRALYSNTTGFNNTALGTQSMTSNTTGHNNSSVGYRSLYSNVSGNGNSAIGHEVLYYNTVGYSNSALGEQALYNNTSGHDNIGLGYWALYGNTEGHSNTAIGIRALFANTTGIENIAVGRMAIEANTTGNNNVAMGMCSMLSNTSGSSNIAIGTSALGKNKVRSNLIAIGDSALFNNNNVPSGDPKDGTNNIAIGHKALFLGIHGYSNIAIGNAAMNIAYTKNSVAIGDSSLYNSDADAENNCAIGVKSMVNNLSGYDNSALGMGSLYSNTEGSGNTANGTGSLSNNTEGSANTAVGYNALAVNIGGNANTAIGCDSGPLDWSLYNTNSFGYQAHCSIDNSVRLGNNYVEWIGGQSPWHNTSDGRFKEKVLENVPGLDFILKLRPVTFNWNIEKLNLHSGISKENCLKQLPDKHKSQMYSGFIAQEVEVAAQYIGYDFSGIHQPENEKDVYSLAYAEFVVPIVKAIQEQQAVIENQAKTIERLQKEIETIKSTIK